MSLTDHEKHQVRYGLLAGLRREILPTEFLPLLQRYKAVSEILRQKVKNWIKAMVEVAA